MTEPTIKDVLAAMTSMEGRLRTEIQESAKTVRNELRTEIQESAKTVRNELRTEIQESAKTVRNELRTEIQDAQTVTMEAIHDLASHMDDAFAKVRSEMAAKDFIDRKVDAVETHLIEKIHHTDVKVERLIDVLQKKDVLTVKDAHRVVTGT